ncbi:hypothetical protein GCM10009818_08590 [Nakamurella flavida]
MMTAPACRDTSIASTRAAAAAMSAAVTGPPGGTGASAAGAAVDDPGGDGALVGAAASDVAAGDDGAVVDGAAGVGVGPATSDDGDVTGEDDGGGELDVDTTPPASEAVGAEQAVRSRPPLSRMRPERRRVRVRDISRPPCSGGWGRSRR